MEAAMGGGGGREKVKVKAEYILNYDIDVYW